MELTKLSQQIIDQKANFNPDILTNEDACIAKNNIDNIIKHLKSIKNKMDENIKERDITQAGIWDIIIKEYETKRLDQQKVKKVLEDNGGLEDFQTVTKSTRMSIKINKERAVQKAMENSK